MMCSLPVLPVLQAMPGDRLLFYDRQTLQAVGQLAGGQLVS